MIYGVEAQITYKPPPSIVAASSLPQHITLTKTRKHFNTSPILSAEVISIIKAKIRSLAISTSQNIALTATKRPAPTPLSLTLATPLTTSLVASLRPPSLDQRFNRLISLSGGSLTATNSPYYYGVAVAVDIDNLKYWVYTFNNGWNGDTNTANQNPATNTGGYAITGTGGALFAGASVFVSGSAGAVAANFGGSNWALVGPPAGFSPWGSSATWDSGNKGTNVTLSGGNLTATATNSNWGGVKSTNSHSSGKYYFETAFSGIAAANNIMIGVCDSAQTVVNNFIASGTGIAYYIEGHVYRNGTAAFNTSVVANQILSSFQRCITGTRGYLSTGKYYYEVTVVTNGGLDDRIGFADASVVPLQGNSFTTHGLGWLYDGQVIINNSNVGSIEAFTSGNTLGLAIDIGAQKVWLYKTKWNNDVIGNQNPATGTGGISVSGFSGLIYPACEFFPWAGNSSVTFNFGATAFTNTIPSGYTAWNG